MKTHNGWQCQDVAFLKPEKKDENHPAAVSPMVCEKRKEDKRTVFGLGR